ncbi:hypothetical protein L2E82_25877 [Cichorium intybus]|uniref:Uncharacterized protein n=1 Tax=Cichorium intybus TaxID=13427 RepID=A0ACB9E5F0_CICIN|nr:hypothetical protein L2E82_25877 [Cichorium intybus]
MIMGPLIFLLDMEDQQRYALLYYVQQTLYTINEDIKFTQFRPSTLTASVILVACYNLFPGLHHRFFKKILRSGYVQEFEVKNCFDKLKDHVLVDRVFNHDKCPLLLRRNVRSEQGKELLIDDYPTPYKYLPNHEHPLKFILEDYENFIDKFRTERQNQEHRSEIMEEYEDQEDTFEITEEVEETEITTEEALGLNHHWIESGSESESEPKAKSESGPEEEERWNDLPLPPSLFLPCPPTVTFASESARNPPPLSLLLSTYRPRSPLIPLILHPTSVSSYSQLFQQPVIHPPSPLSYVPSSRYALIRSKCQVVTQWITPDSVLPVPSKVSSTARFRCCTKMTEEIEAETLTSHNDDECGER